MLVFIDTEVSVESLRAYDYGAVRDDGAVLHTQSVAELMDFASPCEALCGHNLLDHDLKYLGPEAASHTVIDTLPLSPLLFPKKPYHRLVKDDKLRSDELNNPVNDAKKSRDLLHDEAATWRALPPARR